jgi:hypothetical protein
MSATRVAPSSVEYSVWRWRWTKESVAIRRETIDRNGRLWRGDFIFIFTRRGGSRHFALISLRSRYVMPTITLKAHYDGEHIVLDEPSDIPLNAPLLVTLVPLPSSPVPLTRPPPKIDYLARLREIYSDYVMPDEEFDDLLKNAQSGVENDLC